MCVHAFVCMCTSSGRDGRGRNVLHVAVMHGHASLVRALLDLLPELAMLQDCLGRTPLHYAAAAHTAAVRPASKRSAENRSGVYAGGRESYELILASCPVCAELRDAVSDLGPISLCCHLRQWIAEVSKLSDQRRKSFPFQSS
ncbi:unnamed protein product [Protopolystoma xenopodis]|uniref:Uncharacterized protein n=1 Tax=Protopolystoma xenopodis TaxID=117903 RepID=A0A448XHY1_9PLAT|nr:unnamed protein product [Protopolystoma xenopodis]